MQIFTGIPNLLLTQKSKNTKESFVQITAEMDISHNILEVKLPFQADLMLPPQTYAIRSYLPSCYYTFSHGGYTSRHTQKCISPCLFRRIICPLNKISGMCCLWLFFNARNLYALVGPILYACLLTTRQHGLPPSICLKC